MTGQGKQAKLLTDKQIQLAINYIEKGDFQENFRARNFVMFMLSVYAGLRSYEIENITWSMVTDGQGNIIDEINLPNSATKGRSGGTIPMHKDLKSALIALQLFLKENKIKKQPSDKIIYSHQNESFSRKSCERWFRNFYKQLCFEGCSSHSGRATFATNAAQNIIEAGGTIKDVQELLRNKTMSATQRYIRPSEKAKRRVIDMIYRK